jgi:small subunit ribosomal protein S21
LTFFDLIKHKLLVNINILLYFDETNWSVPCYYFLSALLRYRSERSVFMLRVKSRAGESVQQMIRRFKKLCEKEGLIRDMKRNAYYEKPSEKNRRRMRKSQRVINY